MSKSVFNGFVAILAFAVVLLVEGCSLAKHAFAELQLNSRDTEKSRQLALKLKDTPEGIKLALDDINCYGGTTEGWSSWILRKSVLSDQVNNGLIAVCTNTNEIMPRRIEAVRLLWERTGELDWLIKWYGFVQKSGKPDVGLGRKYLVSTFDFGEFRDRVDVPASEDTTLTIEEFTKLFTNHIIYPLKIEE